MVILTGFADEISPELYEQLDVLESEEIKNIEFRGVWGKNVLDLTDEELEQVKEELDQRGFRLSSIGSPIGKVGINDDFDEHLVKFQRAIHVAKMFDTEYIRIFSFFIPEGDDPSKHRDEVMKRMKTLSSIAEKKDVILLHENEKEIYGDTAERCLDIFETCHSPNLRCAFDPANFVQCGVIPFTNAYPLLDKHIEYIHIKDALMENGKVVPAGEGDGQVLDLLQALQQKGYSGFLSLEPHLSAAETFSGFSGPKLFKVASQSLKHLLEKIDERATL
ncbi:sugar phosphate isomerase/epimerase family protein [Pseudalkalibacillus decolorationis]|uniref:sugar phosphate isomerase/epimerase family protein n=1 Tax=Pseudalkalibacillus decolorationis TaxID=163879 RepID=UPI00214777A1|nr:sugar phosphate isomerase/epimerase family protein [Pseudalkalibacillus decolorationis]